MTTAVRKVAVARVAAPPGVPVPAAAASAAGPARPSPAAGPAPRIAPFRAPAPKRARTQAAAAAGPDPATLEAARQAFPAVPDDTSDLPEVFVSHVQIAFLGREEIIRHASVEVFREFQENRGDGSKENTLFDPRMGVTESDAGICPTCEQTYEYCYGHYGYINLNEPIINPAALKNLLQVLKVMDRLGTLNLKDGRWVRTYTDAMVRPFLSLHGPTRLRAMEQRLRPNSTINYQIKESEKANEVIYKYKTSVMGGKAVEIANNMVPATALLQILSSVSDEDAAVMGFTEGAHPKNMVLEVMPVIPPTSRPASEQEGGKIWPDKLTEAYEMLLKANLALIKAKTEQRPETELQKRRKDINEALILLIRGPKKSVIEQIQGKKAIPRKNLMSKRVKFSGRTVISPDPSLQFGQVRVPEYIAKTITWPERINALNREQMQTVLRAGRVVRIVSAATKKQILVTDAIRQKLVPEIGDIYYRWIQNGDYVIVNRNPTLSRHSFQAMEVVISSEMSFGLALAYTTPYNADFDGDEMNIHVPQDPRVVAELKYLASVTSCLMTGSSNRNAMGIVFNSVTAGYLLTHDNPPVDPSLYMQALMLLTQATQLGTLDERLARYKVEKFTGRGLFSAVLPEKMFYRREAGGDAPPVIVREGVLVSGTLTKKDLGPVANSMVQTIWHQEGPDRAAEFITDAVYVLDFWLTQHGFSIGISDCYSEDPEIQKQIQEHVAETKAVVAALGDRTGNAVLDELTERRTINALAGTSLLGVKIMKKLTNQLTASVAAGTKGNEFNAAQTVGGVGQQLLMGHRLEFQRPFFDPSNEATKIEARGFVRSSFTEGLNPAEFAAHHTAAREGVIDTAVNTAESGYMNRLMIKIAEDISAKSDGTVRNSNGVIFQFAYGEDALNPEYLRRVHTASGDTLSFVNISESVQRLNAKYGFYQT